MHPQKKQSAGRFLPVLILGLLAVMLWASSALADDPLRISMKLNTNHFSEPGPVLVTISVTNISETDLPAPVILFFPDGSRVEEFGTPLLAAGECRQWSGEWLLSKSQLEKGKLSFKIQYPVFSDEPDENGNPGFIDHIRSFSSKIVFTGIDSIPEFVVKRTITPASAGKWEDVNVVYEITNTGNVELFSVVIDENESISDRSGMIDSIAAGRTEKYTFSLLMGAGDLTSGATITFKTGGQVYSAETESVTVRYKKYSHDSINEKDADSKTDILRMIFPSVDWNTVAYNLLKYNKALYRKLTNSLYTVQTIRFEAAPDSP